MTTKHPDLLMLEDQIRILLLHETGGDSVLTALATIINQDFRCDQGDSVTVDTTPRILALNECDRAIKRIKHIRDLIAKIPSIHHHTD